MEKQMYSPADGRFLPDRYIEGTCPNCGYPRARGDQCENCTRVLDPTDLIDPRSAISGSTDLEVRETKHLYLRQSLMRDQLRDWIEHPQPTGRCSPPRSPASGSTRRGPAGPRHHPRPGLGHPGPPRHRALARHEGKVFYVWFDAPIEYIGATAEWADAHRRRRRLAALVARRPRRTTSATSSSWARTTCPSTPCSLPRSQSSAPTRRRRALEARRLHQVLQLAQLRGGKFSTSAGPRRLHGPGPRHPARRLLALVAVGQHPRRLATRTSPGKASRRR